MVLFLLFIKAELENISYVELRPDANLRIHVKNPLSDYEVREDIIVDASKFVPQEDTTKESPYHFGLRWEGAKKVSTLTVLTAEEVKTALKKKKNVPIPTGKYSESGSFAPILAVECRGLEPTAFSPMGEEFVVVSSGGNEFHEGVDLSDGDWAEYDVDHDQPVSVTDIEFKWETA